MRYGLIIELLDAIPADLGSGDIVINYTRGNQTFVPSKKAASDYAFMFLRETGKRFAAVTLLNADWKNPNAPATVHERYYVRIEKQ